MTFYRPIRFVMILLTAAAAPLLSTPLQAAHMAMGFRVGEVQQTSAIVWTRITKHPERNWDGVEPPPRRAPRVEKYTPSPIAVADRQGAVPGAAGQVRVVFGTADDFFSTRQTGVRQTEWATVTAKHDFVHQFRLTELEPATRYTVKVEARDSADAPVTADQVGTFNTAAPSDEWQDVTFTVVTGQAYRDLDRKNGFEIYRSMLRLEPDFIVPTGDTIYYDSDPPRARTVGLARHHWHRMYSLPTLVEFHRTVPGYWEKDDHDAWCNDCWPGLQARWMHPLTFEQGLALFREQVPMGEKTHRTVRWGRGVQVWLVEGRDFRSPNDMPDGPEKSIWGDAQREWLLRTILESDADFRVLVSPTPIVGPDRPGKADNHANDAFAHEGNLFRNWTKENKLANLFVCCGDRHWQYLSIDPQTGLHEFSCGPASDEHAGGTPGRDHRVQPFHRVNGGFLSVSVRNENGAPMAAFRHHDVNGNVVHEFVAVKK